MPGERRHQRRQHFGAALGAQRTHPGTGAGDIAGLRRHRVGEQQVEVVVEADHVEPVARAQPRQCAVGGFDGLGHGRAGHRAGVVDHQDQFARQRRGGQGRRHQHQQRVVFAGHAVQEHGAARGLARFGLPFKDEVAVARLDQLAQLDPVHAVVPEHGHGVGGAFDALQRQAGIDVGDQGHGRTRGHAAVHAAGDRGQGFGRFQRHRVHGEGRIGRRRGQVARRQRQRQAQRKHAVAVGHRLPVAHFDFDLLARADVGHRGLEQVRPVLRHQAGALAGRGRGLVNGLGVFLLADLAFDQAFADAQGQRADGGVFRQRQQVAALAPLAGIIAVGLAHRHLRH